MGNQDSMSRSEEKNYLCHSVQTDSWTYSAPCSAFTGELYPVSKWPSLEADYWIATIAEDKNVCSHVSIPPYIFMA
jgi:hypothetical protein